MNIRKNNNGNGNRYTSQIIIILIIIGAFAAGWFVSFRLAGPGMMGPPPGMMGMGGPPAVNVEPAKKDYLEKEKEYIAHVEPIREVDLVPQVEGYIADVLFEEGGLVKKGQLLFTIDSREYRATVDLRTAELAQAEARQIRAEKYLKRLEAAEPRSISQADMDTAISDVQSTKAAVAMARAALELAKIDLGYTRITAPISGRIGPAEVKEGNYVSSATQRLARIVQVDPVRVMFAPADRFYLQQLNRINSGTTPNISARVILSDGMELQAAGQKDFVDNEMDLETGTITVWLRFANPEGLLIPGSYVKLLLGNPDRPQAIMVPHSAVVSDTHGHYIFTVDNESKVQQKQVVLGPALDERVVITSGLAAGESVIVEGVQKVQPGIAVHTTGVSSHPPEGKQQ